MTETRETASSSPMERGIIGAVAVIGVGLSLFQLYTAGILAMTAMRHRAVFLSSILVLAFLTRPLLKNRHHKAYGVCRWVDLLLCGLSVAVGAYIFIDLTGIFDRQGDWSQWDIATGITLILLVLEATRRVASRTRRISVMPTAMSHWLQSPWRSKIPFKSIKI